MNWQNSKALALSIGLLAAFGQTAHAQGKSTERTHAAGNGIGWPDDHVGR